MHVRQSGFQARRAHLAGVAAVLVLAGCAGFTQPEGDGGWNRDERQAALDQRAAVAGVAFVPPAAVAEPAAADTATAAGPLTLRQALDLAAKGNRRIAEAQNQVGQAAERVADTRGRLLPSTTAAGRYTWYSDTLSNKLQLPAGLLPPGSNTSPAITIRERDFGTLNSTVLLPLDLSGELRAALQAAQAGYRGEQARLWATTLEQQFFVVRSYFDLLEAQRLREVTLQTIALDREQVAVADARYRSGRATKNDLLIAQVALQNAEQELVRRDLAISEARWRINEVIGAPIDAATDVVDVRDQPDLPSVADALHEAYTNNPMLVALLEEQQRLDASLRALERSRLPRFNAGAAIDYSSTTITEPQYFGSGFTGFSWDIGTDLRRESQIAEARLALEQNKLRLERELRGLESALRNVHQATLERLSALHTAEVAVSQAEENLRIRQQQFDAGRAQSDDVLRADAVLAQQRATLATALYQAYARRAQLQQLVGLPLDQLNAAER